MPSVSIILKQRSESADHEVMDLSILRDFNLYVQNGTPKGGIYKSSKSGSFAVNFQEIQLIEGK